MGDMPGYGFRPYDDELVGYYLHNKIMGNNFLVEGSISEVNIYSSDPWNLRFQAKIQSRYPVWYFFSRREYNHANGNRQKRRTQSGFWKLTGDSMDVNDKWGTWCGIPGNIGSKRVLVFLRGRSTEKTKSDWVMHELHYTLLPEVQRTYVICRLEYKGDDMNILFANPTDPTPTFVDNMTNSAGSVADPSPQGNCSQWIWDYEVPVNDEFVLGTSMQEHFSDYKPKNPVTGIFADDSDTDSTISSDTSSSTDSVGSSNGTYHTLIDENLSLPITEPLLNYEAHEQPNQLKLQLQDKEKVINTQKSKCQWKMDEDSVKKASSTNKVNQSWIVLEEISQRNSQWIYLKNMTVGFLLFISIIGWIILAG